MVPKITNLAEESGVRILLVTRDTRAVDAISLMAIVDGIRLEQLTN